MRIGYLRPFETMAATESFAITEQWILKNLKLQRSCLADVRSLRLPGSYEMEKIGHLGTSLRNFVRLKTLDLSHNALVSVEGILHLKFLESLNLYYNKISALRDVLALGSLQNLKELDLRLNPVVKKDPFYRLYLVHAISKLRKLDDCAVRDRERKAALIHFSVDSALLPSQKSPVSKEEKQKRSSDLRIASVNRMMSKLSFREGNEETALNHKFERNSNAVTHRADAEESKPEFSRSLDSSTLRDLVSVYDSGAPLALNEEFSFRPGKWPTAETRAQFTVEHSGDVPGVTFNGPSLKRCRSAKLWQKPSQNSRGNLKPAKSNFTPHPSMRPDSSHEVHQQDRLIKDYLERNQNPVLHPPRLTYQSVDYGDSQRYSPTTERGSKPSKGVHSKPMELLLSLVDEYWSGEKRDQNIKHFFTHAVRILCMMEQEVADGQSDIKVLRKKIQTLNNQVELQERDHHSEIRMITEQLQQAQSDIRYLDHELRSVLEENVSLQKQLLKFEQQLLSDKPKEKPNAQE